MCDVMNECYWKQSFEEQAQVKIKYKYELEELNNSIRYFHKRAIEGYVKAKKSDNYQQEQYFFGQVMLTAMILKKDISEFSDSLKEMA